MIAVPTISKRFALKRFLGLSEEEIAENERLWAEENGKSKAQTSDSTAEMRGAGISQAGITADLGSLSDQAVPPEPGAQGMGGEAGIASPLGGATSPAAPAAPAA